MKYPGADVKGLIDKQIELAKLIGEPDWCKKALTGIWNFAFNHDFYEEAINAVKLFPDAESKTEAVIQLATALIEKEEYDLAIECIDEMPTSDESSIENKNTGFLTVSSARLKSGDIQGAIKTALRIQVTNLRDQAFDPIIYALMEGGIQELNSKALEVGRVFLNSDRVDDAITCAKMVEPQDEAQD
ncbi:MAG: hypothetical protein HRU43_01675, partial [Simkaniaceae bacterium]|nr:hypothetical protein [Simkaniaceae bacterium]